MRFCIALCFSPTNKTLKIVELSLILSCSDSHSYGSDGTKPVAEEQTLVSNETGEDSGSVWVEQEVEIMQSSSSTAWKRKKPKKQAKNQKTKTFNVPIRKN